MSSVVFGLLGFLIVVAVVVSWRTLRRRTAAIRETPHRVLHHTLESIAEDHLSHPHDSIAYLAFTIMPIEKTPFRVQALLPFLIRHHFRLGEDALFHYYGASTKTKKIFSMAAAKKPGTFDSETLSPCAASGLTCFLVVQDSLDPAHDFETMLTVCTKMTQVLTGVLCNEQREPIDLAQLEGMRHNIALYGS